MTGPTFAQLATIQVYGLCPDHRAESGAWLDYRVRAPLSIAQHSARDSTVAGMTDRQRLRFDDWKSTVDFHQRLIRDACARECSYRPVVTVELPEVWDVDLAA